MMRELVYLYLTFYHVVAEVQLVPAPLGQELCFRGAYMVEINKTCEAAPPAMAVAGTGSM